MTTWKARVKCKVLRLIVFAYQDMAACGEMATGLPAPFFSLQPASNLQGAYMPICRGYHPQAQALSTPFPLALWTPLGPRHVHTGGVVYP